MISPFMSVLFSLYLVLLCYTAIGVWLYSGLIQITTEKMSTIEGDADGLYYLLNFNDMYTGMLTLFTIFVTNNWGDTTDMYCDLKGNNGPRWYFSFFMTVGTMVILNIIVSFVMDIYDLSVEKGAAKEKRI